MTRDAKNAVRQTETINAADTPCPSCKVKPGSKHKSICTGGDHRIKVTPRQEAIDRLRKLIQLGDKVYTTVRHVSRSGMSRVIDAHLIKNNEPVWIGRLVAKAIEARYNDDKQGVVMGGCGMDMTFALVYELSATLWPRGYGCYGEECRSNDHSNGDRDYTPHEDHANSNPDHICAREPESCTGHKHWHSDGGYALRRESL